MSGATAHGAVVGAAEGAAAGAGTDAAQALTQNLDNYDGRWVALRNGQIVAHAPDEESLRAEAAVRDGDLLFPIGDPPSGFYLLNV